MKYKSCLIIIIISCLITTGGFTNFIITPTRVSGTTQQIQPSESDNLDDIIMQLMAFSHISALSGAIVYNGSLTWAGGYGLANRETNSVATADSIYLVASISKTITATALLQLYEQGKFNLDDDVSNYLNFSIRNPSFPTVPITFRLLLSHHSSLSVDPDTSFTRLLPADLPLNDYPSSFYRELLVPGGLHYIPQIWTAATPGSSMNYANLGFGLLGYLVERISGENFASYCHTHIFQPLEMYNTSFTLDGLDINRLVRPYEYYDGEYIPYMHYTLLDYPAGNLRTTVVDLSHFLIAQMNQGRYKDVQLLSPETIEMMHTIQYQNHTGYNFNYGLGFQIWQDASGNQIGHTGGLFGVSTIMVYREGQDVGLIMFCNKEVVTLLDSLEFSLLIHCINSKAQQYINTPNTESLQRILLTTQLLSQDFRTLSK
jgi:CubicO group peptidase (beta-lactamase class C family)